MCRTTQIPPPRPRRARLPRADPPAVPNLWLGDGWWRTPGPVAGGRYRYGAAWLRQSIPAEGPGRRIRTAPFAGRIEGTSRHVHPAIVATPRLWAIRPFRRVFAMPLI